MADLSFLADGSVDKIGVALYLSDCFTKGVFSGVGKDLWELVKGKAKKKMEKSLINSFENDFNSQIEIEKLNFLIETWIEDDKEFKSRLTDIVNSSKSSSNTEIFNILNSKNSVIKSDLSNNSGTIHIGDK